MCVSKITSSDICDSPSDLVPIEIYGRGIKVWSLCNSTKCLQPLIYVLVHSLTRGRATQVSLTPLSTPGVQDSCTKYKY